MLAIEHHLDDRLAVQIILLNLLQHLLSREQFLHLLLMALLLLIQLYD